MRMALFMFCALFILLRGGAKLRWIGRFDPARSWTSSPDFSR